MKQQESEKQQSSTIVREADLEGLPDWEIEIRRPGRSPVVLRPKKPGSTKETLCFDLRLIYLGSLAAEAEAKIDGKAAVAADWSHAATEARRWAKSLGCPWASR